MEKIEVTVIIPIFNAEQYLTQAVNSVLNQTLKEIEVICVDDGSKDKSFEICQEFAEIDSRIVLVKQNNKGVSSARNSGIDIAKGKYIVFLDSDDYYLPNALNTMVNDISNFDVAYYNHFYDYNARLLKRKPRIDSGEYELKDVIDDILDDGTMTGILFGSSCGAIYRKTILREHNIHFNENIQINEDGIFNIEYLSKTQKFIYFGEKFLYCYRQYKEDAFNDIELLQQKYNVANKYLVKFGSWITNIDEQLRSRDMTISFQLSIAACNQMSGEKLTVFIKSLWAKFDLGFYFKYINFSKINLYKRLLAFLISTKQINLFIFLIQKVYPILKNRLRR